MGETPTGETPPAPERDDDGGAAGSPRALVAVSQRVMAIDVSIQLAAPEGREAAARAAAGACAAFFAEVDGRLSRFKPGSELSRLNRSAGRWFAASDLLFACVELALDAARDTDGLFDPALLHQIEALGYDRDFDQIARREAPPEANVPEPPAFVPGGWRGVALDRARRRIRLPEGVGLDLGGIAKGWAADVALERYCAGFPGALLNLGGDLRLHGGPRPGRAWSVGIRDPRDELAAGEPRDAAVVTLSRGGLATSGAPARWWLRGGERRHHLLDPRTGRPLRLWMAGDDAGGAPPLATATALAPTAARAEVAAKVALLRGHPAALRAVERAWRGDGIPATGRDEDVALLLTFGTGEVALSANMREYLASWGTEGAPHPLWIRPPDAPPGPERPGGAGSP